MPDVIGERISKATRVIRRLQLGSPVFVVETVSGPGRIGTIVRTDPPPGRTLDHGAAIDLYVRIRRDAGQVDGDGGDSTEQSPEPETPLDEAAVLGMMRTYTDRYNRGDYVGAAALVSSGVLRGCGGASGWAEALSQNHAIEEVEYGVISVEAWRDEPDMADVLTTEFYFGRQHRLKLGLRFRLEEGAWKLDDQYPIGAGAFC